MTKLYVNGRFLARPMTGVERYAYMVCKNMADMGVKFSIICPHVSLYSCYDVSDLHIIYYGYGSSHLWEQCVLPFFFIGKKNYRIYNFTGLGSIFLRSKVMTIHDLSFLENPAWFSKSYRWWYKIMTPLAAKTSEHIITVSEFSKREILRFYPFIKEQNVIVAKNSVDSNVFYRLVPAPVPAERFVLAVSSIDPRKNFVRLIEAFSNISDCKLYIVGNYNRAFAQDNEIREQHNIVYLGRVTDKELLYLYNQAVCFVFPSLYEGFGLPPIEAMSCGCPVLVSDIPVLREVCGDAAVYFNPFDTENIYDTIKLFLMDNKSLRAILQEEGAKNVKRFSWRETVSKIISIC